MGLEETKRLLRTSRIAPNKLLGQNFMIEPRFFGKLADYACLSKTDVVVDVGAGFGFLTRFLAGKCKTVIAVEKDPRLADVLREGVRDCNNVTIVEGDVLKIKLPPFDKVVSIPPYYLSSRLVMWVLGCKIQCAVLILQREFAERLVAPVNTSDYGWITVLAAYEVQTELLDDLPKFLFFPEPEVDSVIARLTRWEKAPFHVRDEAFFNQLVRWLFTQRNKKISNSLVPLLRNTRKLTKEDAEKLASLSPFSEMRAKELSPKDFGKISDALTI